MGDRSLRELMGDRSLWGKRGKLDGRSLFVGIIKSDRSLRELMGDRCLIARELLIRV